MIQIYPNPFTQSPLFLGSIPIRNSPLSTYSHVSSTAYEVSIYNEGVSQYSSAFVYKAGDPETPGYYNQWSVYGAGVTGAPPYSFSPWADRTDVHFNYLNYGTDTTSKIRVGYKKGSITSVDIGPYRKNFNAKWSTINSSAIEISGIETYDKLIININNDLSTPLYVFANPIDVPPPAQNIGNLTSYFYVSAGVWELSAITTALDSLLGPGFSDGPEYTWRLNVPYSNYVVYLAPGAYVDGTFSVRGKHSVTFSGPGVIDAGIPYYDNWWSSVGFESPTPVYDYTKLVRAPIYSLSSYSEQGYVDPSNIRVIGPTIANSIIYGASCKLKLVDNTKLICFWPNTDGFHIYDVNTPDPNKYASMTRSFLQTGDDTTYVGGNQNGGDCLISGCYFITLVGTTFRTYFGDYNAYDYRNVNDYWYSAIDIDCRSYGAAGYHAREVPLQGSFVNSIFGISPTNRKRFWRAFYNEYSSIAVTNHLFSGIRVENLLDVPIFDIGARPYPGYDYSPFFGEFSSLIFKDISASSHPNSRFKYIKENKLFGKEKQFRPHDVSFINVTIDNQPITNVNKDDYFVWYNKPIPRDSDSGINPFNGSAIADVYIIIGDSIAAGYDSKFSEKINTNYSSIPAEITGCYIFAPSSNTFEIIKPGVNIHTGNYTGGSYVTGVAALETTLAWKMRQNSGQRDIYIIKYADGGTMPVSSTSAAYDSSVDPPISNPVYNRPDWSVSSNEMFTGFSGLLTSAILNLSSSYKHVDLKAVIIILGTNIPIQTAEFLVNPNSLTGTLGVTSVNPYKDLNLINSLIDTEVSSLVSGIGGLLGTTRLDVDLSYTNYIWMLPTYENEQYYVDSFNDYLKKFNNKVRSFSGIENYLYATSALSSTLVPLKITPYLPPSESYYRPAAEAAGGVHYNFSGYAKITDDIYQILQQQTSSTTDPDLNPDVNITFRTSENPVVPYTKVDGAWKEADSYVKVNGQWKFSVPSIKSQSTWKGAPPENGVEIYNLGSEALRSSMYSVQVFNGNNFDNSYVYSSTARFGPGGVSGARAAFSYDAGTNRYRNRLWYRNDKPIISYTTFGTSATSRVKVSKAGGSITSADIRPRSKNYNPTISNGQLELSMNPKDKAWVTINGDVSNTLFVFCDPPKPAIPGSNILYFGPGIHHLSALAGAEVINASSPYYQTPGDGIVRTETFRGASYSALHNYGYVEGQPFTIYLDGGAYVIGQFDLRGKNNVKVIGPGILAGDNVVEQCFRFPDDDFQTRTEPYGILSQLRAVNYAYQEQGLNTYDRVPSGLVVSGPTIVNTHMINMPGMNTIDNIKLLSPFMTNTDIKAPMPDGATSAAIMRDSLIFLGDDAIIPTPYNAYPTIPNTGYVNVGGRFDISGCQVYTTNGGPLVIPYFGVLYPSSTPNAYPIVIRDMDFGIYTYNEGGGGANGIPLDYEHGEVAIRVTMDMSSIYSGTWPNGMPKYGIHNVTVSNIRFDDPIDQALFWVGNVPDPYFPTPVSFRGDEYGHVSGITFKNISVSSIPGFSSKLYSNLIFAKNSTNRPKNITFENIRLDGTYLTNSNYSTYFTLSGINATAPNLISDNITFVTGTA
jgi:hypothetical protein